jgi:hypothetical protein
LNPRDQDGQASTLSRFRRSASVLSFDCERGFYAQPPFSGVLPIQGEIPEDERLQVEKLQNLIGTYGDDEKEKEALISFLDRLVKSQRPSLIDRFNIFAENAKMLGWEKDIQAFKKFNRIRNSLIHRGDPKVKIHVKIGEEEVHALEDLSERFVNYYLFQDTAVYQSRFLPRPKP